MSRSSRRVTPRHRLSKGCSRVLLTTLNGIFHCLCGIKHVWLILLMSGHLPLGLQSLVLGPTRCVTPSRVPIHLHTLNEKGKKVTQMVLLSACRYQVDDAKGPVYNLRTLGNVRVRLAKL